MSLNVIIAEIAEIVLAIIYGWILGWACSEYRYADRELKRVREQFDSDKKRYAK